MKTKRSIIVGVLAGLIIAYVISIAPGVRQRFDNERTVAALRNLSHERVEKAVEAFSRDQKARDGRVPSVVSLRELVSAGHLHVEDIRGLEGRDATVSVAANASSSLIWVRVSSGDGFDIVRTVDGGIGLTIKK